MHWTADSVAALKALFIAGQSKPTLAEYFGVTEKAIDSKLKRMGLARRDYFPNQHAIDWTDKNIATLTARWAAGVHARDIANELKTTKGSVIGKAHRLGLAPPTSRPVVVKKKTALPFVTRSKAPPPEAEGPVRFIDLDKHHCRWVLGEPTDLIMCGKTRHTGSPYCPAHDRIAFNPAYRKSA